MNRSALLLAPTFVALSLGSAALGSSRARAASYVDAAPLARSTAGVALLGGTPLGRSDADARASVIGGGGSELAYGVAWESGWSLAGLVGAARWSSRGPLSQTLRDRDASLLEGWAGVGVRRAFGDGEVAPFLGASLLLDALRVRGTYSGDASGLAVGARAGIRWRELPWNVWAAVDVRHARLSAPYDEADRVTTTRLALLFGVDFEGALR